MGRFPLAVGLFLTVLAWVPTAGAEGSYSLWPEPAAGYAPVYRFILSARHSLDMVMYELDDPTAEHDLAVDAARGVDVRALLDSAYHGGTYNRAAAAFLRAAGAHVNWAPSSVIVHEKAVVVDDRAAMIMTVCLVVASLGLIESPDKDDRTSGHRGGQKVI